MTVYFAPERKDPNEYLKQVLLQYAMQYGERKRAAKKQTGDRARVRSFAESISPPDITTINDQRLFSPAGQQTAQDAWLGNDPGVNAKLGTRPGQQNLSQQQILIKALQAELSLPEALQAAQVGRRPTAPKTLTPSQIAQQRRNLWFRKQPEDVQEEIYRTKAGLDKPTEKEKYQNQVQYWVERGFTQKEAMENVKTASEMSAGITARASAIKKLKDKPLPDPAFISSNIRFIFSPASLATF